MTSGIYVRTDKHRAAAKIGGQKRAQDPELQRKQKEMYQDPEWKRKQKEGVQKCAQDPEWIRKQKEGIQKSSQNPEWIRKNKEGAQKRAQDPEWQRKNKEGAQKSSQDPEWIRKNKEMRERMYQDPEWKRKQKEGIQKSYQDPERRRKQKEGVQKCAQDPEWRRKQKEGAQRKYDEDSVYKQKMANGTRERANNYEYLLKNTEFRVGGFWYGNVNYNKRKKYCVLWNRDLWTRIDSFQNFKSILSNKTKEDNNGKALSRHHVYYNTKACCEWDEDIQGYYVMIDIGTKNKPDTYKYYIDGDPNKFVLLTKSEHSQVSKEKLKWIRIFEELIKTKYNGKCYYTKEDLYEINRS